MTFVYFAERDGLVKIGASGDPRRRTRKLRATLIKSTDGGFKFERALHDEFVGDRVRGEWFQPSTRLMARIEALPESTTSRPFTTRQVADLFNVSPTTVAAWADADLLPSFRTPGGHRRFRREVVEAFLRENPPEAASA